MTPIRAALVAGVPVDDVTTTEALTAIEAFIADGRTTGRTFQVATINVDFVVNARRDPAVLRILQRADLCLCDGMPILWHSRLTGSRLRDRVAGADLVPLLVDRALTTGWRVLLFGSAPGVAEAAAERLTAAHPGAVVRGLSGPFMSDVTTMDRSWLEEIAAFGADIVCVALGNPKQEKWIDTYRDQAGATVFIGVGGTLDFLVGERRRAPAWMQRSGLEWLYRAAQEPRRLGRRYVHDAVVFAPHLVRAGVQRLRYGTPTESHVTAHSADGVDVIDLTSNDVEPSDASLLVGLARNSARSGARLRLVGCSSRTEKTLRHLDIVDMFESQGSRPFHPDA